MTGQQGASGNGQAPQADTLADAVGTERDPATPSSDEGDPLLTPTEAAARLRVSKMTVYRLIHAGQLPAFQIGKAFRIKTSDLSAYLEACEIRVESPRP